jgi:integrase
MAKTILKKGWIGPLKQSSEGKQPWVCDYCCPLTGKKRRKSIAAAGTNKKERERAYHDFRHSLADDKQVSKANLTFNDAADAYEKWCEQRLEVHDRMEAGTIARIRFALNTHLRPDLGTVRLMDMTTPMIQEYIYAKAKKYRALHYELYQQIRSVLERAVWLDMLSISPLDVKKMRLPPRPESVRTIPTIEEGRALWHAMEREGQNDNLFRNTRLPCHSWANRMAYTALAMFGGMCAGEIAGLQWEHVDFVDAYIYVEHSWSRWGGLKGPKNPDRHRYIILSAEMNKWLTKLAKRDGHPRTGFVFKPDPKMRNWNWQDDQGHHLLRSMTQGLKAAQVRLGFVNDDGSARWSMHELRHYAGSVWLELGYRLEDVARMLGHGKIETTKKYYIHYFKKQNLERDRQLMAEVSKLHRLPPPRPMREIGENSRQAADFKQEEILGGHNHEDD